MKSKIFYTDKYKKIETDINTLLNKQPDFLSKATISSTRATGDAIQGILEQHFQKILGDECKECNVGFARRAMADIAFTDQQDCYYVVDVKTHRLETKFNMPNITSVERLARFYEEDKNYFIVLMIEYAATSDTGIKVEKVHFLPIEFFSWKCLTLGALGWGQIQIANASKIQIQAGYSRKTWMLEFCDTLFEFYPREIEKTKGRIEYFKKVKKYWDEKPDIWK